MSSGELDASESWERRREELALALDGVLASRWLRVLERLEAPVRIVRPGLGTLRARLESIRRHC